MTQLRPQNEQGANCFMPFGSLHVVDLFQRDPLKQRVIRTTLSLWALEKKKKIGQDTCA